MLTRMSEAEPSLCPICIERFDDEDKNFFACPCNYQVCVFCVKRLLTEFNAKCPACREPYKEDNFRFASKMTVDQTNNTNLGDNFENNNNTNSASNNSNGSPNWSGYNPGTTLIKKTSSRPVQPQSTMTTKQLSDLRIIQHNLIYVIGLSHSIANEQTLTSKPFFGQYGKIKKIVVGKNPNANPNTSLAGAVISNNISSNNSSNGNDADGNNNLSTPTSAYVTFESAEDAQVAIKASNGYWYERCMVRSSLGTTKYCHMFLKGQKCQNPDCSYLHKFGKDSEVFTKEEMQNAGKTHFPDIPKAVPERCPKLDGKDFGCFPPRGHDSSWRPPVPKPPSAVASRQASMNIPLPLPNPLVSNATIIPAASTSSNSNISSESPSAGVQINSIPSPPLPITSATRIEVAESILAKLKLTDGVSKTKNNKDEYADLGGLLSSLGGVELTDFEESMFTGIDPIGNTQANAFALNNSNNNSKRSMASFSKSNRNSFTLQDLDLEIEALDINLPNHTNNHSNSVALDSPASVGRSAGRSVSNSQSVSMFDFGDEVSMANSQSTNQAFDFLNVHEAAISQSSNISSDFFNNPTHEASRRKNERNRTSAIDDKDMFSNFRRANSMMEDSMLDFHLDSDINFSGMNNDTDSRGLRATTNNNQMPPNHHANSRNFNYNLGRSPMSAMQMQFSMQHAHSTATAGPRNRMLPPLARHESFDDINDDDVASQFHFLNAN